MQLTEEYKIVRPWIRTAFAFLIYLIKPVDVTSAYHKADMFQARLEEDVKGAKNAD